MGFNAGDAAPALEWDFTKYAGENAKGVSPEPTNQAMSRFVIRYRAQVSALQRVAIARAEKHAKQTKELTDEELEARTEQWAATTWREGTAIVEAEAAELGITGDEPEEFSRAIAEEVAKMLNDCPNVDQIMALPGRVRGAFFGWIVGQVGNPESWAVGTRRSLETSIDGDGGI